ncbi:hypothetical protein [Natrinema sp. 74]|uniref:hypothetical protein n=1 Tax=Natrinema sp. 74 TaxID=3384159 RepID=UPI0038D45774
MLDDLLILPFEAGIEWLIGRDDAWTTAQQLCLFFGIVFGLLAIALAVVSELSYGLAAGIVALGLLLYGS